MTLAHSDELTGSDSEGLVEVNGEGFYCIPDVHRIPPFLMSVVSDGDRWMFVSSTGGLTAGRANSSKALFPYVTDDRLHDEAGSVGPVTAIRVVGDASDEIWRPFRRIPDEHVSRALYKSVVGDSVIFEERHSRLNLRFRYRWSTSDRFGFIRTATLANEGDAPVHAELVDGLLHLLPYGLDPSVYQRLSNLTNAYKRSEVIDAATRFAVFSLEAGIVDRPEPAEVLRGTVAWSVGLDGAALTVSPDALSDFDGAASHAVAHLSTGRPGAYLLQGSVDLDPGSDTRWHIVADVAQDQVDVTALLRLVSTEPNLPGALASEIQRSSRSLVEIMAPADALQRTGDRVATAHQFANVTYNVMRGGVPLNGYRISTWDFMRFLRTRNRNVADRHEDWLKAFPETIDRHELLDRIDQAGDPQLVRLGQEYLPFSFARRHGDPSRPWNAFSIRTRDDDGRPVLYYEGNWRDIFQNWEALCMSFPEFLPSVISVFVDASTPDGFNPYRITRDGIDWEVPDPDDPWSGIGYWGDHQIVYLLRLLEASDRYLPGRVGALLGERLYSYADVPYRIAPYDDLVRDPKATIHYDEEAAARSAARVNALGGDGKLVTDDSGEVYLATLAEKLLVPTLAKLSNFVPGGGIWMNTERPEWNDANNALVGYGLSMVTLYQLRRYLEHLSALLGTAASPAFPMSTEVADWLRAVSSTLHRSGPEVTDSDDRGRKELMDDLGAAFDAYRSTIYASGFSGTAAVTVDELAALCSISMAHLDATIRANRRSDGLYHSYNVVRFTENATAAAVEHLFEMLEGQVAVLDSGVLSPSERADVVDALFSSPMYRADQGSFMLYPVRHLPPFLEKNVVPAEAIEGNALLRGLLDRGDRSIVMVDEGGLFRFSPDFSNARDLDEALDALDETWSELVRDHRVATLDSYEQVFDHHAYTGRSGSMYGYEGIGSIYWHMVAKLLVAVQGSVLDAVRHGAPAETTGRLIDGYWRVRSGLGFNKTAEEFGAMPLDPYSHTPAHAGAQQPGMTGLVKEELLTRPLEVGVRVEDGEIHFDPILLRDGELLQSPETWPVYDVDLKQHEIDLPAQSLGMTICQVPVVVTLTSGEPSIEVFFTDGATSESSGPRLDDRISAKIFARSGEVAQIHAFLPPPA